MGFITESFATNVTNYIFRPLGTMKSVDVFGNFFSVISKSFGTQSTRIKPSTIMILIDVNLILKMGSEFLLAIDMSAFIIMILPMGDSMMIKS